MREHMRRITLYRPLEAHRRCPLVSPRGTNNNKNGNERHSLHAAGTHDGLMAHTPDEHETGTAVGGSGDHALVDGSVLLAEFRASSC